MQCPTKERLQRYLDDYAGTSGPELDDHIETCSLCQEHLERLSAPLDGDLPSDSTPNDVPPSLMHRWVQRVENDANKATFSASAGFGAAQPNSQSAPRRLGDYEILREIGRGGMGVVYEARQLSLDRSVALKILPQTLFASRNSAGRFRREARAASHLHHTNIVPVYEVGEDEGTLFYAMQLIDGIGLDSWIRQSTSRDEADNSTDQELSKTARCNNKEKCSGLGYESLNAQRKGLVASSTTQADALSSLESKQRAESPPATYHRTVAEIGTQISAALSHAHNRGVIHRDVKPSNLLLDQQGVAWLADFGLAKQTDDGLTGTMEAPGTLRYMSPERFQGQCDQRSDVYALGVSLYELLAQQPVFRGNDHLALLKQIQNDQPTALREIDPEIPRDLQTIVAKAMAKDAARRYATADEFGQDLRRFLEGEPIRARRVSLAERVWLRAKKERALATSLAAVFLLLVTAAIGSIFAAHQQAQLAAEKAAETREATKQRDEARQNAYFADMRQAHQDLNNGQMRRMLTTLRDYLPTVPAKDVRGWEWYYLLSQAHQDAVTMTDFDGVVTQTEWSADGKRLFTLGTDETLRIWNPDGSLLRKIVVPGLMQFALNPDSTQIVAVSGDPVIRFFDAESGKLVRTIKQGNDPLIAVDWHPTGEMVALIGVSPDSRQLFIVATNDEQIVWKHRVPVSRGTWAKFSPVGDRLLVAGSGISNVVVFQLKKNGVEEAAKQRLTAEWINSIGRLVGNSHQPLSVAWHPDGRQFAVGAFQQGIRVFEIDEESDNSALVAHFQNPGSVDAVTFSNDGEELIVGNRAQRVDIYDFESKQRIKNLAGHLSSLRSIAADPTGKLIASSSDDGAIKVWHRTDPAAIKKSQVQYGSGTSPDGRFSWQQQGKRVVVRDRSGEQIAELKGYGEYELTSRFFPEVNRCLFWATEGDKGPPWIRIYDTQSWKLEYTMKSNSIAFPWASIVGDFAVMSIPKDVERFNGRTGKVDRLKPHPTELAVIVALSPNGEWLATACQGEVKLWDIASGIEIANLYGHRPGGWMPRLAWGNSGRYFATSSTDQTIRIWDAEEKAALQTLRGLQSTPRAGWFAFSADDTRFLGADSETYRVWDVQTGRELLSANIEDATMGRIYDAFQSKVEEEPFGLTESQFRFETLRKAEALSENKTALEQYKHQSQHSLARTLIGDQTDERAHKRALTLATRALELNPTDPEYLMTHAVAAYRNGKFEEALTSLKLAIDSGNTSSFLLFLKAMCLKQSGKVALSQEAYLQANEALQKPASGGRRFRELVHEITQSFVKIPIDESQPRITVTTLVDEVDGRADGPTSLREALLAVPEGGVIEFDVTGTIELKLGPFFVDKSVTIVGPGADKLTIDGGDKYRLMILNDRKESLAKIVISGLHFTHGRNNDAYGYQYLWSLGQGSLFSRESLTLSDCLLDHNQVPGGAGGALFLMGDAKVVRCVFNHNQSKSGGGAIMCSKSDVEIDSCTFESNKVTNNVGSAVRVGQGKLTVVNSTFSENEAPSNHGAIGCDTYSYDGKTAVLRMDHCTLSENIGGALHCSKYPKGPHQWDFSVSNCIFYDNVDNAGRPLDVCSKDGIQAKISHSIIGVEQGGIIDERNNLIGVDPKLGPLANNGGPTKTFALRKGSPAIDAGSPSDTLKDQRGMNRDDAPDMGAFEFESSEE